MTEPLVAGALLGSPSERRREPRPVERDEEGGIEPPPSGGVRADELPVATIPLCDSVLMERVGNREGGGGVERLGNLDDKRRLGVARLHGSPDWTGAADSAKDA